MGDENEAVAALERNGYYRLSAYWFPFRKIVSGVPSDNFLQNSSFEDAMELYRFDKELRILLMDVIERIEIATRVQIALVLGQRDTFAHENPAWFNHRFVSDIVNGDTGYNKWIGRFNNMVDQSSEEFVTHHKNKYGQTASLPIWIAIELWDFGMTSILSIQRSQRQRPKPDSKHVWSGERVCVKKMAAYGELPTQHNCSPRKIVESQSCCRADNTKSRHYARF